MSNQIRRPPRPRGAFGGLSLIRSCQVTYYNTITKSASLRHSFIFFRSAVLYSDSQELSLRIVCFWYKSHNSFLHCCNKYAPWFIMTRAQQTLSVLLLVSSVCYSNCRIAIHTPSIKSNPLLTCLFSVVLALPRSLSGSCPPKWDRPERSHPGRTFRQTSIQHRKCADTYASIR